MPKSIKHRSKFEVQGGFPLGIDFKRILVGLGRQAGKENRAKTGQDRARQDKDQGKTRQDFGRLEVAVVILRRGGGVRPAIRGILHWFIPP